MKKKNFLLSLFSCCLLLGGCSDTGDENPVVNGLASELEKFAGYTELRCDTISQQWYESDHINVADMMTLPGKVTYEHTSKLKVKGLDALMLNSEEVNHRRYDFTISECLPVLEMSKEQAKEMFDYYSSYFLEYQWDEANDHCYLVMDNKHGSEPDLVLVHTPSSQEQGYNVYFKDNKMKEFKYLLNNQSLQEYNLDGSRADLIKMYQDHVQDVVLEDGQYVLDLKEKRLPLGLMEVSKLALKIENDALTFTCDGIYDEYGLQVYDLHATMRFYAFGNAEFVVPSYELHCPFEHACQRYEYYNEQGHVLACTYCHKYMSTEVHEHHHDDKHDICYDCFNYIDDMYTYEGDELKINGQLVCSYSENKVGTLYWRYDHMEYDVHDTYNVVYGDDVYDTYVMYNSQTHVLVLEAKVSDALFAETCINEEHYKDYIFKDVTVTLTSEQEAQIEEHEWYKDDIYCTAIGIPDGYEALVEKYGAPMAIKDRYRVEDRHEPNGTPVEVEIGCITWWYWTCKNCGMDTGVQSVDHHHWVVTEIVHPSWGKESEYIYFKVVCTNCAESSDLDIYAFDLKYISLHSTNAIFANGYTESGQYYGSYSMNVPHCDLDHDDHCDLCGTELTA